ncbi:hypothetical protein [Actinocorallia herbida]|uniref:hypothetical protein n=1 Tax=Actinocorallia herbida TaxID=58109 RepID=UPI000F4B8B61|nr:hypothetical protein [Actinocorallia herbida]
MTHLGVGAVLQPILPGIAHLAAGTAAPHLGIPVLRTARRPTDEFRCAQEADRALEGHAFPGLFDAIIAAARR